MTTSTPPKKVKPTATKAKSAMAPMSESATEDVTPLDYMLKVMRDPTVQPERRDEMAKLALPYLHPKAAAESGKDMAPPDAAKLTETDIARRIAFALAKVALAPSSQDEGRSSEAKPARQPLGALGSR